MTLVTLKKNYREKIKRDGNYSASFPTKNEKYHSLVLKNMFLSKCSIRSRGEVSYDALELFPFHLEKRNYYLDAIFAMEYWLEYANIHNLSTIRLVKGKDYANGPTWLQHDYIDTLKIFKLMGFVSHDEGENWSLTVERATHLFPAYQKIREAFENVKQNDITFTYRFVNIFHKNAFLCFNYEWEGTDENIEFLLVDDQYSFIHLGKEYSFNFDNLSEVIAEALQVTTERNKLKNLLNPPTDNIGKLVYSLMGYRHPKIASLTNLAIMEKFIELGYTYKEVETEAVRLNEGVQAKIISFGEKQKQITVRFFDTHYLVLLVEGHDEPLSANIVSTEKEVIDIYQNHLVKNMTKKFEEAGITIN